VYKNPLMIPPHPGISYFGYTMQFCGTTLRLYLKNYCMNQQIIQVNFQFTGAENYFEASAASFAGLFAAIPGLHWKIWLLNKEKKEAGGIYLFSDDQAANDYRHSELLAKILANPKFSHFTIKQFGIMEAPGVITNAPVAVHY
jgi:hypothetical protein